MSTTGTFYILKNKIIYTLGDKSLDHYVLWDLVVKKVFTSLSYEDKLELMMGGIYGTNRGRVVLRDDGKYVLYGTPDCFSHVETLQKIFNLRNDCLIDFNSDLHYRVNRTDERLVNDFLRNINLDDSPLCLGE